MACAIATNATSATPSLSHSGHAAVERRALGTACSQRLSEPRLPQVWVPRMQPDAPARIMWMHAPKTGTLFGVTVYAHSCGPASFNASRISTQSGPPRLGCDCSARLVHPRNRWHHDPLPPLVLRPGAVAFRVVTVVREPRQRLLSTFRFLKQIFGTNGTKGCWGCCCGGWGLSAALRTTYFRTVRAFPRDAPEGLRAFLQIPGVTGCQTKMVMGRACADPSPVAANESSAAVGFVRHRMAFVGIAERRLETLCLWHATFGTPLWSIEVSAAATAPVQNHTAPAGLELDDAEDAPLYAAAVRRFESVPESTAAAVRACVSRVSAFASGTADTEEGAGGSAASQRSARPARLEEEAPVADGLAADEDGGEELRRAAAPTALVSVLLAMAAATVLATAAFLCSLRKVDRFFQAKARDWAEEAQASHTLRSRLRAGLGPGAYLSRAAAEEAWRDAVAQGEALDAARGGTSA